MENLGRYEIVGEIGRGGCGVVYRALDPGIGRTVAIKTIRADGSGDGLRERFRREARSAGSLSHPNIVTIHEFSDSGDVMFIAMEFVDGQTLAQLMQGQKLPLPFILTLLRAAADALDFAHAHNIVHRDVKPANFLVSSEGRLKITDFGIAKMLDDDVGLTNTGMVIGTAQYISPEQIAAKEVTPRSDQFSLGVVAYEMLAGQRPFQGNSWASMIHSIIESEPPSLAQFRGELTDQVTEVLRRALAKEPLDRYESCLVFVGSLEDAILGDTAERTAFWESIGDQPLSPKNAETVAMPARTGAKPSGKSRNAGNSSPGVTSTEFLPPSAKPAGPTFTHEIPRRAAARMPQPPAPQIPSPLAAQPERKRVWMLPAIASTVVAFALGVWFFGPSLEIRRRTPEAAQVKPAPAAPVAASQPKIPEAALPVTKSEPESEPAIAKPAAKPAPKSAAKAEPVTPTKSNRPASTQAVASSAAPVFVAPAPVSTPTPAPATASTTVTNAAPAVVEQPRPAPAPVTPPAAPKAVTIAPPPAPKAVESAPPPAVVPIPPPVRTPDPAEVAAQKRAADLQASRKMITDAIARYRQAFESKNIDGLKAVWPGMGRTEQTSFQNFFRIARSVRLDLTPVGEPEFTTSGATVRYRRSMSATDSRGALPTQDQTVKITFRKSGEQMLMDSIEADR